MSADLDPGRRLDDPVGVGLGNLREREALEHAHVANGLTIEPARPGERVHHILGLDPVGVAAGDDQLAQRQLDAVGRSCGFEWRLGRGLTVVGATCASRTHGASLTPE